VTARLEIRELSMRYRTGARVLAGVSLALAAGESLGLLGPNGCGKTSLLRAVLQFVPPEAGEVRLDGRPLAAIEVSERARRIAYLPQGAQVHWPLPAARVVALGAMPYRAAWGGGRRALAGRVAEALAAVGAEHLGDRLMSELSGGERMLVHLARLLVGEPALILADEPVANLDPQHQLQVMAVLAGFARAGGSVVTVLHDLTLAARFCSRAAVLGGGRVLADGAPGETLTPALLTRAYGVHMLRGEHEGEPYIVPWRLQE